MAIAGYLSDQQAERLRGEWYARCAEHAPLMADLSAPTYIVSPHLCFECLWNLRQQKEAHA